MFMYIIVVVIAVLIYSIYKENFINITNQIKQNQNLFDETILDLSDGYYAEENDLYLNTVESKEQINKNKNFWKNPSDGSQYLKLKGDFNNGMGRIFFSNGDIFEGEWLNSKQNGIGKETFASGEIYEGEFKNGKLNGKGKFISKSYIYVGSFKNDKMSGFGTMKYATGDIYEGKFKNDKMHDTNGKTIFANGAIFVGEYKNDYMIHGKFSLTNGDVYIGNFNKNNKMHGLGSFYSSKSDETFHGKWDNGKYSPI